jgi:hypothetical protein
MDHRVKAAARAEVGHRLAVADVAFNQAEGCVVLGRFKVLPLETGVVIGVEVVEHGDAVTAPKQRIRDTRPDKPRPARYEHAHTPMIADGESRTGRSVSLIALTWRAGFSLPSRFCLLAAASRIEVRHANARGCLERGIQALQ